MAPDLDSRGWYHGKELEQATGIQESLNHKMLYALLATCTATGFVAIAAYLVQFIRLMLSLFVLPGKSVCPIPPVVHHVNC